jgi:hypothetical protein
MSPPNRQSLARISEETGIHVATLYVWRKGWRLEGEVVLQNLLAFAVKNGSLFCSKIVGHGIGILGQRGSLRRWPVGIATTMRDRFQLDLPRMMPGKSLYSLGTST